MELSEIIKRRYSVRAYQSKPVEEDKLLKILEAARLAPTAANRQPFQVIVIQTRGREAELRQIYNREWFTQAPLVLCVVGTPESGWIRYDGINYTQVDSAIVMDHIILSATDLGLGTCWIAAFNPEAARSVLGLPENVNPIVFTPLGYPNDSPKEKVRKPLADLVRYESW
jgi:nitroreductase